MLNFVDADVRDVAKAVLGGILHVNYTVASSVHGTITLQTSRGLSRNAVLPTFAAALRANGLSLAEESGLYKVVPLQPSARHRAASPGAEGTMFAPGQAIQVVPLEYASAAQVQKIVTSFLPPGSLIEADTAHNLLFISGTRQEIEGVLQLASTLDVDWLAGKTFGLFPLHSSDASNVVQELTGMFGNKPNGPTADVLRFIPIERMNAILVISAQSDYLRRVGAWIDRLDRGGDENTPHLYVFYVENANAANIADVLNELFSGQTPSRNVNALTAPGEAPFELKSAQPFGAEGTNTSGMEAPSGGLSASQPTSSGPPAPSPSPLAQGSHAKAASASGGRMASTKTPFAEGAAGGPAQSASGNALSGVRIVADEGTNSLVIWATPRQYRKIEPALRRLDAVPLQVAIEATIAEVTLNNELRYGLQWFLRAGSSSFTLTQDALAGSVNPVLPGFSYVLSKASARVVLSALSAVTTVHVISSPQLVVRDHQSAYLQVGNEVPIAVQQAQSVVTPQAPVINTIQYKDTGVILRVRPRVSGKGLVTLDIEQEVSDVARTTTSNLDSPTIEQRRIMSSVSVESGQTIALGGLIRDTQQRTHNGVPVLSDLPVIGNLFGTTDNTAVRTELLVLITPRVIRNSQDAAEVTQELRSRLHAITPLRSRAP